MYAHRMARLHTILLQCVIRYLCLCSHLQTLRKKLTIPDIKYFNGRSIVESGCSTLQSIGRNFLHYAASNGNFYIFISLTKHLRHVASNLLQQRDAFGKTPVDVLFISKPPQKDMTQFEWSTSDVFQFFLHLACLQFCRNTTHLSIS